jgi:hypothetical protein
VIGSHVGFVFLARFEEEKAMRFGFAMPAQGVLTHMSQPILAVIVQLVFLVAVFEQAHISIKVILNMISVEQSSQRIL